MIKLIKNKLNSYFGKKLLNKIMLISKKYDLSKIMQKCADGLKDSSAGGHKTAAGASIMREDLDKFKERLSQIKLEDYKIK